MNPELNKPFFDHLEELRARIIKSILAVVICSLFVYVFSDNIIKLLISPVNNINISFQVLKITSIFLIKLTVSLVFGLFLSFPIVMYQIMKFILPAFDKKIHYGKILFIVLFCFILFIIGLLFGYFILIPLSIDFFSSLSNNLSFVAVNYTLENYLVYLIWMLIISSSIFQLPFIIISLNRIGIISREYLRNKRKHIIVLFFIMAAFFTPPDPISQILVVVPLYVLFELSILLMKKSK